MIPDPRRVKKPSSPFIFYVKEQYGLGRDLPKGEDGKPSMVAATKALLAEFTNFSPEERKVCFVFFFRQVLPFPSRWLDD